MPPAGSKRTLHAAELTAIAQRYSIRLDAPEDVCFEWPMETLDAGRVMQAMRDSLQTADAHIEITETSLVKVPHGRLDFPLETLGKPAPAAQKDPVLWRGQVIYGADRRFPVWAKVRIHVACQRTVATEPLKLGQPVGQRQFRIEPGECFPGLDAAVLSPQGMVAKRAIAAGAEIRPELVAPPNDVNRGDAVHVEVRSGGARLAFIAKAESGGRDGDFIAVRNPSTNKIFRARIQGKDQVLVQTEFVGSSR
jgi:flagella basal body P-ring formation protein FlgA